MYVLVVVMYAAVECVYIAVDVAAQGVHPAVDVAHIR